MDDPKSESSASGSSSSSSDIQPTSDVEEQLRVNAAAEEAIQAEEMTVDHYHFLVKYANKSMEVRLAVDDTVTELKAIIFSMTDIPPERQKIFGLMKGKLVDEDTPLGDLQIPGASLRAGPHPTTGDKRITISLVGTPIDQTFRDPGARGVEDDSAATSDINYNDPNQVKKLQLHPSRDPKALARLRKAVSRFSSTFDVINEPREGLKGGLLVLDLDYTIADTKRLLNYHISARESERPGLHEFLAAVYPYYDICVWSQTTHWWLEAKLTELGCLTDERYKISFVLDRTPMFNVTSDHGRKGHHQVKALEIIWKRFPQLYGPHNTVHIDDLSRNFAMNPNCGLKIKAYKDSPSPDSELVELQEYLVRLANFGLLSFEELGGHENWKKLLKLHREKEARDST
ncbi:hypothetical protein CBS101457_006336 [Exobasidium rhododendri]|nr:hypothetical protein CBS101457_006336 [Exobasidium rhododendri]